MHGLLHDNIASLWIEVWLGFQCMGGGERSPYFSNFRSQIPISFHLHFPLSCSSQIDIHASGCSGAPRGPDLTTSRWMWVLPVVELKGLQAKDLTGKREATTTSVLELYLKSFI